ATVANATLSGKTVSPNTAQTKKYPTPTSAVCGPRRVAPGPPTARRQRHSIGTKDGIIIAPIITTHLPSNDAAAPAPVCPCCCTHAIDIGPPPGIGISPIADMDDPQRIVAATLTAKISAETPRNTFWEPRAEAMPGEISSPPVCATPNRGAGGAHGAAV